MFESLTLRGQSGIFLRLSYGPLPLKFTSRFGDVNYMQYIKLDKPLGERKSPPRLDCDPDRHQILLLTCSFYHPGPLHEISSQAVHNFLSNIADIQTDRQTNATKNIISLSHGGKNMTSISIIQIFLGIQWSTQLR